MAEGHSRKKNTSSRLIFWVSSRRSANRRRKRCNTKTTNKLFHSDSWRSKAPYCLEYTNCYRFQRSCEDTRARNDAGSQLAYDRRYCTSLRRQKKKHTRSVVTLRKQNNHEHACAVLGTEDKRRTKIKRSHEGLPATGNTKTRKPDIGRCKTEAIKSHKKKRWQRACTCPTCHLRRDPM